MLFKCHPDGAVYASESGARSSGAHVVRRRGKSICIDIHCHYHNYVIDAEVDHLDWSAIPYVNTFVDERTRKVNAQHADRIVPSMSDLEVRLRDMDRMGIDIQAISPATEQYFYWTEPEIGRSLARQVNDGIADLVSKYPDRFVGLGTIPLQHPEFAVQELNRLIKELGLRGVEIGTNVNGVDLASPELGLEPVFAALEELDVLAFMHPRPFNGGRRFAHFHMSNIIGQPLDSTVAVTRLIFEGVLERHPGLKICVAHSGGYLPFYHARMDHAFAVRPDCQGTIPSPPSTYLRQLYFDTVVYDPDLLRYLVCRYGADRVLLGTDYPYDMAVSDPVGLIDAIPDLGVEDRCGLKGQNAARLLKLLPA